MNYLPIRFKSTAVVESDSAGSNGDDFNGHRGGNYHNLDATKVTETLECLGTRIHDRFPNCGLKAVCGDLTAFSRQIRRRAQTIIAPNYWLRLSVGIVVVLSLYVLIYLTSSLIVLDQQDGMSLLEKIRQAATGGYSNNRHDVKDMAELMQAIITIVTFIAACMIFLVSIERRLKRRQILHDLHELRSFTHVIDMHQLTKSPDSSLPTDLSLNREMTGAELTRYLDFCSEMLSLTSKLAAIYAQHLPDPVVIGAVNDIETLTTNLSRKIWQKISIVGVDVDDMTRKRMAVI